MKSLIYNHCLSESLVPKEERIWYRFRGQPVSTQKTKQTSPSWEFPFRAFYTFEIRKRRTHSSRRAKVESGKNWKRHPFCYGCTVRCDCIEWVIHEDSRRGIIIIIIIYLVTFPQWASFITGLHFGDYSCIDHAAYYWSGSHSLVTILSHLDVVELLEIGVSNWDLFLSVSGCLLRLSSLSTLSIQASPLLLRLVMLVWVFLDASELCLQNWTEIKCMDEWLLFGLCLVTQLIWDLVGIRAYVWVFCNRLAGMRFGLAEQDVQRPRVWVMTPCICKLYC